MTIMGYHTSAELTDLINAYQAQYADQQKTVVDYGNAHSPPSADWADFMTRWANWSDQYKSALATAQSAASVFVSFTETDKAYTDLATAFAPATDFDRELRQKFLINIDYSNTPQPTATDLDIGILKGAQKITAPIVDPLVGDKSLDPSKSKLPSSVKAYAIAAGIGAAAILILRKVL